MRIFYLNCWRELDRYDRAFFIKKLKEEIKSATVQVKSVAEFHEKITNISAVVNEIIAWGWNMSRGENISQNQIVKNLSIVYLLVMTTCNDIFIRVEEFLNV